MKQKEIYALIMELGVLVPDDHIWSNDLRQRFDKITSYLSSY